MSNWQHFLLHNIEYLLHIKFFIYEIIQFKYITFWQYMIVGFDQLQYLEYSSNCAFTKFVPPLEQVLSEVSICPQRQLQYSGHISCG